MAWCLTKTSFDEYIPIALHDAKHRRSATLRDEGFQREIIAVFSLWCKRKLSFRAAYKPDIPLLIQKPKNRIFR
ncbi:MAG: hypothetical protein BGO43_02445 [Gammaproteobacteria bacterium 39-13]|nr:MAG: hypothetical protein BGO43_02445 [Gammaproteobacteria bacterium 39-13]